MKKRVLISLIVFSLACTKEKITLVPAQTSPEGTLITTELKHNYINRLSIGLLGRKASESEWNTWIGLLGNGHNAHRINLVQQFMQHPDYALNTFQLGLNDYLDGLDTASIGREIRQLQIIIQNSVGDTRAFFEFELQRLQALATIPDSLAMPGFECNRMHRYLVDNAFYDDINMGTENFVVACFQQFLHRYPTDTELEEASRMVDGQAGLLFFQNGNSKANFLDIFFNSQNYWEGQVIHLHEKYFFERPGSVTMSEQTKQLIQQGGTDQLLTQILSSDAYFFQ